MSRGTTARRALVSLALLAVSACGASGSPETSPSFAGPSTRASVATSSSSSATASPAATSAGPGSAPTRAALPDLTVGATVVDDLSVPWGMVFTRSGDLLFSQRGSAHISLRSADGTVTDLGQVPGVVPQGEGGLLGLALSPDEQTLFAYRTASRHNQVVAMSFDGRSVGPPRVLLDGIPKSVHHDGGRLAIGPDQKLYVTTGDAEDRSSPQDLDSLGGKILRLNLDGTVPSDNPFGTPVWTYGHRNVQGIAWDSAGRMWSSELGQNTEDEFNLITAGSNYGWPLLEGNTTFRGGAAGKDLVAPQVTWPTSQASPSGLIIVDDVAYVMALRGQRIWQVPLVDGTAGQPRAMLVGALGRVRSAVLAPDGDGLWVGTSNESDDTITDVRFS